MAYIDIPKEINYKEILENDYSLSSNTYKKLLIKNKNFKTLRTLLVKDLTRSDLGVEVGSLSYIKESPYCFMRSKALQEHSFLPEITNESMLYILPKSFKDMNLKKGDVIISKDSNIGEAVILEKDYPNTMLSGAIYKLPLGQYKYYTLAMIKHRIFREQLDFIVPKGVTIRHAKQLFLDCKIPFPNHNRAQIIAFIETLTKSIIEKEKLIKERHKEILNLIESELSNNQGPNTFSYSNSTFEEISFEEIQKSGRLDTGVYCEEFKKLDFLVKNYKRGVFYIDKANIKSGSTPKIRFVGKEKYLKYQWITPSHCSDYGTIKEEERINFKGVVNLTQNCILISNATSKGKKGEFVGIATFYAIEDGEAHYNQQLYGLIEANQIKLIFMLCFLNCKITRKICSYLCVGSKMKGMKIEHFLQIPFPNFPQNLQEQIALLYHNPNVKLENLNFENFQTKDEAFCRVAGIYELDKSIKHFRKILDSCIDDIANNKEIKIDIKLQMKQ